MLKQRVISALVLALVVVGAIFHPDPLWVRLLFGLILFAAMMELTRLTVSRSRLVQALLATAMAVLFLLSHAQFDSQMIRYHAYVGLVAWGLVLLLLFRYRFSGHWSPAVNGLVFAFSALLVWVCINSLVFVHGQSAHGPWILIYILTLVWVADIGAYFAGRRFGRHKLAPGISPGKTWEGVFGGIALNALWISLVFALSQGWGMDYPVFLLLGLATSAISVVGDLYESILKREAGMKDSGRLLPGHGGVLDRIDSVIAAAPVYLSGLFLAGAL